MSKDILRYDDLVAEFEYSQEKMNKYFKSYNFALGFIIEQGLEKEYMEKCSEVKE